MRPESARRWRDTDKRRPIDEARDRLGQRSRDPVRGTAGRRSRDPVRGTAGGDRAEDAEAGDAGDAEKHLRPRESVRANQLGCGANAEFCVRPGPCMQCARLGYHLRSCLGPYMNNCIERGILCAPPHLVIAYRVATSGRQGPDRR